MLIKQAIQIIKLLGLRRAAKMKKRHEKALPLIRGYAATTCFWTLLNVGFWDDLSAAGSLGLADYCATKGFDPHVLGSVCSYLDGIRMVDFDESTGAVRLTKRSRELLAEPRGLFELLYAYEPVFVELEPMLRGQKKYGPDVQRRTRWVGLGSGNLCRQLPYPVMIDMARRHGCKRVLDLGCGDGAFLMELASQAPTISGVGIDLDAPVVQLANQQIAAAGLSARLNAVVGDMFDVTAQSAASFGTVDCLTACDTFHEYLWNGDERVIGLLRALKSAFPKAVMVIGEFCKQSHESLRKRPTAFLEHHLFHQLTNQRIETANRWLEIFHRAGLHIREEKVFDLVGHGYFVVA
ncbi:MAG: class I SAM-dependent methyltransferase [Phycisphaerae bacterium]|nr:class I SAM-dependent methyltransferase [Phycisphaerae bacterium]